LNQAVCVGVIEYKNMSEKKTEIVEKRVKSTIIRRRRKVVDKEVQPKKAAEAEEKKPLESSKDDKVSSSGDKKETKTTKKIEKVEKEETKKTVPIVQPITKIKKIEKSPIQIREEVKKEAKKEEDPKAKLASDSKDKVDGVVVEESEDKKKKKKAAKKKTVDETANLSRSQLIRSYSPERVFQPGKSGRKKKIASRKGLKKTQITETKAIKRVVEINQSISVQDLAHAMGIKANEIIKSLMNLGTMATINQVLDFETASVLAEEFNFEAKDVTFDDSKILSGLDDKWSNKESDVITRPPVVTVMGHVDHGKTSLLDAIRQADVASGEAGGITQHIGAYTVTLDSGKITFLDTPGHAAFTAMRARGAKVTDVVILVVAADDGVMPQTIESIDHAKAADVPIVVAVNKVDKPDANPDQVIRQLSEHGLVPEDWGGDTIFCPVSAKENTGVKELLENVLLQAEVLELKANPNSRPRGVVVEAELDRARGAVATVLVQDGTLKVGDYLVAGGYVGKTRALVDAYGKQLKEAGPSQAVEIMGLEGVPQASDSFDVVPDEKNARKISDHRLEEKKQLEQVSQNKVSLEDFFSQTQAEEVKELNVVVKADTQGSVEAVRESLLKISTDKVKVKVIHQAVGGVNESDVLLASASNAVIIGFHVRPETKAIGLAKSEGVDIKLYKIIYEMVDAVKLAMQGLLAPLEKENYLGRAEVRETFTVSKVGQIAGCYVIDGKLTRNCKLRLLRDNVVVYEGEVSSLKRFKDDAKEVKQGFECGTGIQGYQDIKVGDVIEAFEIEYIKPEL
jgi:translation initiation factor IF-2